MSPASVSVAIRKLRELRIILSEDIETGKMRKRLYRPVGDWECILVLIEEHERKKVFAYMEKTGNVRSEIKNKYGYLLARPR
jgi:hypothetical protein